MKESNTADSIQTHLYRLIIPEDILSNFEIESVIENQEELLIVLVEKEILVPLALKGKEACLDGYLNAVTLQHFSVIGKKCYLQLKRRGWKEKGQKEGKSVHNEYQFTASGTMATQAFGAFLKRNSLIATPSTLAM